jgi:alkanesulfonate monooxygenase SsuD/methylene tetrahydromethanopterin reductase-like flavin-dependent oxidoreductase (luciferase family)
VTKHDQEIHHGLCRPDRGQNATPANERRYSNEHLASAFAKTEAIAKKMDALGFDTLWLTEEVMPAFGPPRR